MREQQVINEIAKAMARIVVDRIKTPMMNKLTEDMRKYEKARQETVVARREVQLTAHAIAKELMGV